MRNNRGTSLTEIMIALVVLGVGISAVVQTLPRGNRVNARAKNLTKATNLAQEKIEQLMNVSFTHPDLNAGTHTDPANPLQQHFARRWEVQLDTPLPGMKQVDVTVSFATASKDSTARLQTYVTSRR